MLFDYDLNDMRSFVHFSEFMRLYVGVKRTNRTFKLQLEIQLKLIQMELNKTQHEFFETKQILP